MKTVLQKAKELVIDGFVTEDVFKFFDNMNKDVIDYIHLFGHLGIDQDTVWHLYEEWQEI